jgi:phosphatidylserine/phosphatidylglycerophosphate/cardiolipin synthase-like enzyme
MKETNTRIGTSRESKQHHQSQHLNRFPAHFPGFSSAYRVARIFGVAGALGLASFGLGGCRATAPDAPNYTTARRDHNAGGDTRFDERGTNGATGNSASPGLARNLGPQIQALFSPRGGCTEALVREIGAARRSIWVQAYSFTSAPIAEALVKAQGRGVQIRAVLDKSNQTARYTGASFLQNARVPVLIDHKHAIAHNKIMIFDGQTVATGSFNFTKSAENSNAENLLIIKNAPSLVRQYQENFENHAAHSTPYERRESTAGSDAPDRE